MEPGLPFRGSLAFGLRRPSRLGSSHVEIREVGGLQMSGNTRTTQSVVERAAEAGGSRKFDRQRSAAHGGKERLKLGKASRIDGELQCDRGRSQSAGCFQMSVRRG